MSGPHPKELRERVVWAITEEGQTIKEAAERFHVGEASAQRWLKAFTKTGSLAPAAMGGARRKRVVDEEGEKFIIEALNCNPDLTLVELCVLYDESRGIKVARQRMSEVVRRLGYTRKKGLLGARHRTSLKPLLHGKRLKKIRKT